jgi:hypothetical protein
MLPHSAALFVVTSKVSALTLGIADSTQIFNFKISAHVGGETSNTVKHQKGRKVPISIFRNFIIFKLQGCSKIVINLSQVLKFKIYIY